MARINATAAKAAAALAAVQLTTILQDATLTELFNDYKDNHHPMRGLEKLFLLAPATGVVTSNDAFITAAYAGAFPTSGIQAGRQSQGPATPIALSTATVEDAAPTRIILTFDRAVIQNPATAISIAGTVTGDDKVISSIAYAGAVVTITVTVAYINGDTISTTGRFFGNHGNYIDLAAQAVTNNVAA
jgi:hypothetical protein